jgi:hypothetical protein
LLCIRMDVRECLPDAALYLGDLRAKPHLSR